MITRYVYVNSYVTSFDFDSNVIDKIKEIGGLDTLQTFNNRFEDVPKDLIRVNDDIYKGFINGIVYSQYTNSGTSGNYLNPLLMGLSTDYKMWEEIMKNDDVMRDIVYIEVPYETYCELTPMTLHTSKEEYDSHGTAIKKLTNALIEGIRKTIH
jgi:hypothetical protein